MFALLFIYYEAVFYRIGFSTAPVHLYMHITIDQCSVILEIFHLSYEIITEKILFVLLDMLSTAYLMRYLLLIYCHCYI